MSAYKRTCSGQWLVLLLVALMFSGCGGDMQERLSPVPDAYGDINQLVVIADKSVWEGPVGDTLDFYYASAFPILPQPEPMLDLSTFTAEELLTDKMRRELRNYLIIANLGDSGSPAADLIKRDLGEEKIRKAREDSTFTSIVGYNKWAKNQLIVYLFAFSEEDLVRVLKRSFPAVLKKIREVDRRKIEATVFVKGESEKLEDVVREKMGLSLRVPKDYVMAINDGSTIWMRNETPKSSSNILIHKIKYTSQSQLTKEGIKSIRDSLGRKYISSTLPKTYMKINDVDLPLLVSNTSIDGKYALEARGIWEIVNDYMGGSFVSYLIHNPDSGELIFLDGFLHAPGENKRDLMLYLDHVLKTVRL